jgi:hypothetical protein
MRENFKKYIAIPQDHGSWVFILSPLLIGVFAGRRFTLSVLSLFVAAMSAFMLRQPMTVFVKAFSGRRPKTDLPPARFWVLVYGMTAALALLVLIAEGYVYLLYLALAGAPEVDRRDLRARRDRPDRASGRAPVTPLRPGAGEGAAPHLPRGGRRAPARACKNKSLEGE